MRGSWYIWALGLIIFWSCNQEEPDLPSVEERKAARTAELVAELTAPADGWRLNYKPTRNAGTFLILMKFTEDGKVRIQSDVADEDGKYLDQTITYRIDHDLATELILETYGVFHYLFEQNQNTFGAEFEFLYAGKVEGNLVFRSKTDFESITTLTFQPAQASDTNLLSREIIEQLKQGAYTFGDYANYQIYIPADDISIFSIFDISNRRVKVLGASSGFTFDEIVNSSQQTSINFEADLSFVSEEVVFDNAAAFNLGGKSYSFSGFKSTSFTLADTAFCEGTDAEYTFFEANADGLGQVELTSSLFTSHSPFFDEEEEFYIGNYFNIYDENDSSIFEYVEDSLGEVAALALIYNSTPRGYNEGDSTITGFGFAGFDENNRIQWYIRKLEVVQINGNLLELTLTDETFINVSDSLTQRNALFDISDRIFEGGKVYATESLFLDDLFVLYNPCSQYTVYINGI